MSHWGNLSKSNLLSLSQEQNDFKVALKEWKHTGMVKDHLQAVETCQLCDHSNLRYHFEIVNRVTKAVLQVGSSCIKKFNITVYDDEGNELFGDAKSQKLDEEISQEQRKMMLQPLRNLWKVAKLEQNYIRLHVEAFRDRNGFSPENLLYLFRLMEAHEIAHKPQIYKVVLRSNQDKRELFEMSAKDLKLIWPSLSASQKQRFQERKEKYQERRKREEKRIAERQQAKLDEPGIPSLAFPEQSGQSMEKGLVDLRKKVLPESSFT